MSYSSYGLLGREKELERIHWRHNSHYPTEDPCDICGITGDNGIEPRYGYITCEEHKDVRPAERHLWKKVEGYKK